MILELLIFTPSTPFLLYGGLKVRQVVCRAIGRRRHRKVLARTRWLEIELGMATPVGPYDHCYPVSDAPGAVVYYRGTAPATLAVKTSAMTHPERDPHP